MSKSSLWELLSGNIGPRAYSLGWFRMRGPSQPEFGAAKSRWYEPGTGTGPHPASGEAERETRTELIRSGEIIT